MAFFFPTLKAVSEKTKFHKHPSFVHTKTDMVSKYAVQAGFRAGVQFVYSEKISERTVLFQEGVI